MEPLSTEVSIPGQLDEPPKRSSAFFRAFDASIDAILGATLLCQLAVVFGNVLTRSILGVSLFWSDEITQLGLVILAFIGGAASYHNGEHIAVSVVSKRLSDRARNWFAATVEWLILGQALVISWESIPLVLNSWSQRTLILGVPASFFVIPLPLGMALLVTYAARRLAGRRSASTLVIGLAIFGAAAIAFALHSSWAPLVASGSALAIALCLGAVLVLIGAPMGFVLSIAAIVYYYGSGRSPLIAVPLAMQAGIGNFILVAIPFFILAGVIMESGGISARLVGFVVALAGHIRGGLLHVVIISMYLFSGVSGSKSADIVAVGSVMAPMLRKKNYPPGETVAVLASSAAMGETVPPSIVMLIYASLTSLSVGALFLAGFLPALFMSICLHAVVYIRALRRPKDATFSLSTLVHTSKSAFFPLVMPALLAGGVLLGFATPTEISVVAVVYGILLAVVYREMSFKRFWSAVVGAAHMTGMILIILSFAYTFSQSLTVEQVANRIADGIVALGGGATVFLFVSVVVVLVMGSVLEGLPALLIFAPILLPVANSLHINPIHFGILLIIAMSIGYMAPPIGLGIYIACSVGGASMDETVRPMAIYVLALFIGLVLVMLIPPITLVLPNAFGFGLEVPIRR